MARLSIPLIMIAAAAWAAGCEGDATPEATPSQPGVEPTPTLGPTATPQPTQAPAGAIGVVVTDLSHRPIPGATTSVGGTQGLTDSQGRFALEGLISGATVRVEVSAAGYATGIKAVSIVPGAEVDIHLPLQPLGREVSFIAAEGYGLADFESGGRVVIPPNAFERPDGAGYGGAVTLRFTSHSLEGVALNALPGALLALEPNGPPKPLAAYGAITVEAQTAAGEALSLRAGQPITVEIPLGEARDLVDGASLPLWALDGGVGQYRAASSGQVQGATLLEDRHVVTGQLGSLGTWVAARARAGAWLGVTVAQKGGGGLAGGGAIAQGGYPAILSYAWGDGTGGACLRVPAGETAAVTATVDDQGVLFTATSQGQGGDECSAAGVNISLGLGAGCIGGEVLADGGGPSVGAAVWSDAATLTSTGVDGSFCLMGPDDRAVTVRSEGFNERSIRPSAAQQCGAAEPACTAQLSFAPGELGWTYRLATLGVAPPDEGLDLDGDGQSDNGLAQALNQGSSSILESVDALLDALVDRDILSQDVADDYYQTAVDFVEDVDSTLGVEPLQEAIGRGSLMWIMDVAATAPTATFDIYEGRYQGYGFDRGDLIVAFSGEASGADVAVGPSDLSFVVPTQGSSLPGGGQATVRVLGARVVATVGPGGLTGGLLGGAVPKSDILAAADAIIPDQIPEGTEDSVDIPKEEILAALDETLTEYADLTVNGGEPALSAAMALEGLPFSGAECDLGYWANNIEVAPAGEGLDLDDDGQVDNASEALFAVIADVMEVVLAEGLIEEGVPVFVANETAEYAADLLRASLAIDAVNDTLAQNLGDFREVPLMTLTGAAPATLSLYDGVFTGEGYAAGALAWQMSGAMEAGALAASTDVIVRAFAPDTPVSDEDGLYSIAFYLPRATATVTTAGLTDGMIGYAMPITQILELVASIVENLQTLPALDPDFGDPLYQELEETLVDGADLDLGELGPAYSMAYRFTAPRACLASPAVER